MLFLPAGPVARALETGLTTGDLVGDFATRAGEPVLPVRLYLCAFRVGFRVQRESGHVGRVCKAAVVTKKFKRKASEWRSGYEERTYE